MKNPVLAMRRARGEFGRSVCTVRGKASELEGQTSSLRVLWPLRSGVSWGYPPPPGLYGSVTYTRENSKIFEFKGLIRKIFRIKDLGCQTAECTRHLWRGNLGKNWKAGSRTEITNLCDVMTQVAELEDLVFSLASFWASCVRVVGHTRPGI